MYARVLREGTVRPGDGIRILPPADDSRARLHRQLDVFDSVERDAYLALWRALRSAGIAAEILDDGELAACAAPSVPSSTFNRAFGLRQLPNLLDRLLVPFLRTSTTGWLVSDEAPWRDAVPGPASMVYARAVGEIDGSGVESPSGLVIRRIDIGEAALWAEVAAEAFEMHDGEAAAWSALTPHLVRAPGEQLLLAEADGEPAAIAALFIRRRVGLLAAAAVRPAFRRRGIQRALIADRIARAVAGHSTSLLATAEPDGPSARNLEAAGFERIWDRRLWRFDPELDREAALAAAELAAAS
jgi:GNAT superfamily N-acetyltransferase